MSQETDKSLQLFKAVVPALWLSLSMKRGEFVDPVEFKNELGIKKVDIPSALRNSKCPVVSQCLPYLQMLVSF